MNLSRLEERFRNNCLDDWAHWNLQCPSYNKFDLIYDTSCDQMCGRVHEFDITHHLHTVQAEVSMTNFSVVSLYFHKLQVAVINKSKTPLNLLMQNLASFPRCSLWFAHHCPKYTISFLWVRLNVNWWMIMAIKPTWV